MGSDIEIMSNFDTVKKSPCPDFQGYANAERAMFYIMTDGLDSLISALIHPSLHSYFYYNFRGRNNNNTKWIKQYLQKETAASHLPQHESII